ncbi:MAG: hypothetical protein JRD89_14040 [Deltaproteobacteria bacterium]|nr:hypothetical protein [Deltaproteobacteria bacterium]
MRKKYNWDREWLYNEHIKEGKSIRQIALEQGVHWNTIQRHLIKNGIPIQKHGKQYPNLEPSPELSYILGVIAGDGYVSSHSYIELDTKDYAFAQEFRRALKAIGLRANVIERNHWIKNLKRQYHGWKCYIRSVVFVDWFNGLTQEQEEGIAGQYPWEYIRGMFESEGSYYVNTNGSAEVVFSNFDYNLLLMVQRLLTLLGYESNIYEREHKEPFKGREITEYSLHLLGSSKEKHEFIKKLNPVIKNHPHDYSDPNGLRGRKPKTRKGEPEE